MHSDLGLEVMNSINPKLNWMGVTKGRRSRKSVARSFNSVSKLGNSSPRRVGDFSGSDSDKPAAPVIGQPNSGKSEHVPIKKRRHVLRSPSPQPLKLYSNLQLRDIDGLARAKFDRGFNNGTLSERAEVKNYFGDFSGIELLATAASMEDCADKALKEYSIVKDYSIPGSSVASIVVSPSKLDSKCNESVNSLSTTTLCADSANCLPGLNKCAATSQSSSGSMTIETTPKCVSSKVDRRHWDLNTVMDAWAEPCEDSTAGNTSKGATDYNMHIEELMESSEELPNPVVLGVESLTLKREDKLGVTPDRTSCTESPSPEEHLVKSPKNPHSSDAGETSNQAIGKDVDANNSNHVLSGVVGTPSQVVSTDVNLDGSFGKQHCSSILIFEEKNNTMVQDEHLSSLQCSSMAVAAGTKNTISGCKVANNSLKVVEQEKLVAKHEESGMILQDTCNSYSARAKIDDQTAFIGKVDTTIDPRPNSPYEDGELRVSFSYSWEKNELETECVDYESDGRNDEGSDAADNLRSDIVEGDSEASHSSEGKSSMIKRSTEGTKYDSKNNETCGKTKSNGGSGSTVEQSMVIDEKHGSMKRWDLTTRNGINDCKALMGEYVSRMARGKLQSRIEEQSSLEAAEGKDVFFLRQCRSRRIGGFHDTDASPEKYVGKYRPSTFRSERGGGDQWTNWGSRSHHTSNYLGTEGRNFTRPRRSVGDSVDKFGGLDFHEQRQNANYFSNDSHRPFVRTRSPVDRDDRFSDRKRMPLKKIDSYRSKANYLPSEGKDFGNDFEPIRFSRMPRRDRSFSPNPVRDAHMPLTRRRSRSNSRTRSPRAWHSFREGNFSSKRLSRSPDFRSEARMERIRVPFQKPNFESEYREGYMSPPRGRFPPHRNSRWADDDRNFVDNNFKRRKSPVGGFRCNNSQSFNSSGRLKSDEYFRPVIRPRRFSFMENDGKFANYDNRKFGHREEINRVKYRDNGGDFRRFQREAVNDFETRNLNKEEGVQGPAPKDVVQGYREDKKESGI